MYVVSKSFKSEILKAVILMFTLMCSKKNQFLLGIVVHDIYLQCRTASGADHELDPTSILSALTKIEPHDIYHVLAYEQLS